jgi:hypothetical protein
MRFTGFVGPSYTNERSFNIDRQRCVNLFPERNELGLAKEGEQFSLLSTPGLTLRLTLAGGVVRGMWKDSAGRLFAVGGNKLYQISNLFVATERGTLQTSTGIVGMADNGLQLVIVDGANGYYYTYGNTTFTQITDDDFLGANRVSYQDGYFIFDKPNSGQFYISGLNTTDLDGLDFATSEGNPDNIVGHISVHRDLWMFNEQTTEIFYNSGDAAFPFTRIDGAFIEYGCAARASIAKDNNTVFWLGRDSSGHGIVYQANGYTPQRISTHPVEQAIQSYSDFTDAVGFCYQSEGHNFYVLNFPTANTTWVFDSSTGFWHERAYTNEGILERHRANFHAFAFGKHLVGDYANGKIYELSNDVFTDDGTPITRNRTAPHVSSELDRLFHECLQLDVETGVGIDGTGQGTNPMAMLEFSDDGGHSWSNEKWTSLGKIGVRNQRVIWRRLGCARDRVYSITITDPVKVAILGAVIKATKGAS